MDKYQPAMRDVTGLVLPSVGSVVQVEGVPGTVLLDAAGAPMAEVGDFFASMLASGCSVSSLRSYGACAVAVVAVLGRCGCDLAASLPSRGAGLRVVDANGRPGGRSGGYAPATINHALAVVKMFYVDRATAGEGPVINPIPDAAHRLGRRVQAHHNPMQAFTPGRRAPLRQRLPQRLPRSLPDGLFDALFATVGSDRDRALLAFYVSTGARASELLGVTADRVDPGEQRIGVHRKGSGRLQWLPASAGRVRVAAAIRAGATVLPTNRRCG